VAAEVAGEAHLGEGGRHARALAGDPLVAGERERHAGPGRYAVQHGDRGLGHLVQQARRLHAGAELVHAGLGRIGRRALASGARLHVAAGGEAAAGAGQHHATDLRVGGQTPQRVEQQREHLVAEGVEPVRAVHGEQGDAVFATLHQQFGFRHPSVLPGAEPTPRRAAC
jgi:hypothetical protein